MVLLWLEKVNWTDFFCKNGIPYTNCQWKSKKQDKKRAKTLQKRCIFHPPRPAGSVWTDFDPVKICSNRFGPVKTRSNGFWPGQNLFERILTRSKSVQTEPAGWWGWKNHLYWRVFACFLSCFLLFHWQFVYGMAFLQKKSVQLTFSSHRSVIYKVPPHIGGHHFLLCQQTNTKDIAG